MIYTLTLNPSIDYIMRFDKFIDDATIRSTKEEKYPGGKGIMVSKLLKNLGYDSINLGFIGGFTGQYLLQEIDKLKIKENFTRISDDSRINVKLKYNHETEINADGPTIKEDEICSFFNSLDIINKEDTLVISGSIPKSLDKNFYKKILEYKKMNFTIDMAGAEVLDYLKYKPLLIKPNIDEMRIIFNKNIDDKDVLKYARILNTMGAQNVIVSEGAKGSIFVNDSQCFRAKPVEGKLINSVGAGDSMVGGFIYGLNQGYSLLDSYKLAIACGSATAFSPDIGKLELINKIYKIVEVEEIGN